jgi:magnesium-transporting ATPase (P-type)
MKIKTLAPEDVYNELGSSKEGLSLEEVNKRLKLYGPNQIEEINKNPLY